MESSSSCRSKKSKKYDGDGIISSSSPSRKKSKKCEGDDTMKPRIEKEEEVKEEEWELVTGGEWKLVWNKSIREYGDHLKRHVLKVPANNLTYEALKNRVRALGFPIEHDKFGLSYMCRMKLSNPRRSIIALDMTHDVAFSTFMKMMDDGRVPKPVTLYHRSLC